MLLQKEVGDIIMETVYINSAEEYVNYVVSEFHKYPHANTLVFNGTMANRKELRELSKELSRLVGRKVVAVNEGPDEEHPYGSSHLAYIEENGGEKLTLEQAFKEFYK